MATLALTACTVDLATGRLTRASGANDRLSRIERGLLTHLVENEGRVISREELLRAVWRWKANAATRAPDVAVRRLRRRVEADAERPDHLFTIHGVGYRFSSARRHVPDASPAADQSFSRVAGDVAGVAAALRKGEANVVTVQLAGASDRCLAFCAAAALGLDGLDDDASLARALASHERVILVIGPVDDARAARVRTWVERAPLVRVLAVEGPRGSFHGDVSAAARAALDELRATGLGAPFRALRDLVPRLDAAAERTSEDALLAEEVATALRLPTLRFAAADLAVRLAEQAGDPAGLARALYRRATARGADAAGDVARADAIDATGPLVELARASAHCELSERDLDNPARVVTATRLATIARTVGRLDLVRRAWHCAAHAHEWAGRPAETFDALARLEETCRESNFQAFAQTYGATVLLTRARFVDAVHGEEEIDALLLAFRSVEVAPVNSSQLLYLASALAWDHRYGEARALAWEAGERARRQGSLSGWLAAQNNLGVFDALEGRWGRAAERFAEVRVHADAATDGYRRLAAVNLATITGDARAFAALASEGIEDAYFDRLLAMRRLVASSEEAHWTAASAAAQLPEEREALGFYRAVQLLGRGDTAAALAALRAAPPRLTLSGRLGHRVLERALRRAGVTQGVLPTRAEPDRAARETPDAASEAGPTREVGAADGVPTQPDASGG